MARGGLTMQALLLPAVHFVQSAVCAWATEPHSTQTHAAETAEADEGPLVQVRLLQVRHQSHPANDQRPEAPFDPTQLADEVRAEMKFTWDRYRETAWGRDDAQPVTGGGRDSLGGIGVTILDSLDTLWLMGLKEEFEQGREFVANELDFAKAGSGSVFEITIRALGGLLSAYTLSGDQVFLKQADDLGARLLRAFPKEPKSEAAKQGPGEEAAKGSAKLFAAEEEKSWKAEGQQALVPARAVALGGLTSSTASWAGSGQMTNVAEMGSVQLEFRYLAAQTNKR
eukprot:CAMPEP_0179027282 /NCGR_PEP_ID=MMETSP0796-20121207/8958_1 /TAXON_ID=73915 /ORGANISM="Pyrodinium bahamense, Strain pbaha01" /LENGTH=283 /DNA_ID=CAMNT_0020723405 /DNA_START=41 /DNA_END=888 /DNA_ORIENTATION=+